MRATINPKAVRAIAPWASKNSPRRIITAIKIELIPGAYRLVATDAYGLAVIEGKRQGNGEASLTVDASALADQLKESDDYLIIDTETMMAYAGKRNDAESTEYLEQSKEYHRAIIKLRDVEGSFPEWQKLIPDEHEPTTTEAVAVNPKYLKKACKLVSTIAGKQAYTMRICLQSPTKPALFWCDIKHLQTLARTVVMPIRENDSIPTYC